MSQEMQDAMARLKTELESYTFTATMMLDPDHPTPLLRDSSSSPAEVEKDRNRKEAMESPVNRFMAQPTLKYEDLSQNVSTHEGTCDKLPANHFPRNEVKDCRSTLFDKVDGKTCPSEASCLMDKFDTSNCETLDSTIFQFQNESVLSGSDCTYNTGCSCVVVCPQVAKIEPGLTNANTLLDSSSSENDINTLKKEPAVLQDEPGLTNAGTMLDFPPYENDITAPRKEADVLQDVSTVMVSSDTTLQKCSSPFLASGVCCTYEKVENSDKKCEESSPEMNVVANSSTDSTQRGSIRDCCVKLERLSPEKIMHYCSFGVESASSGKHASTKKPTVPLCRKLKKGSCKEKMIECEVCCKRLSQKSMSKHLKRHRTDSNECMALCQVCGLMLKRDNLRDHLKRHLGTLPRKFECKYCGEAFTRPCLVQQHERTHTDEKPFQCPQCPKRFAQRCAYTTHLYVHSGEKPHECKICQKRFVQKSNLNAHLLRHSGYRPYACNVCDKRFYGSSELTKHLRIHSGLKPYSCEFCQKSFAHSGYLITHKRIHTGERPFKCDTCGASFPYSGSLRMHIKRHTGLKRSNVKRHQCRECGKKFARPSELEDHFHAHA